MLCMANKMRRRGGDGDGDTSVYGRASVRARHEPNVGGRVSCFREELESRARLLSNSHQNQTKPDRKLVTRRTTTTKQDATKELDLLQDIVQLLRPLFTVCRGFRQNRRLT